MKKVLPLLVSLLLIGACDSVSDEGGDNQDDGQEDAPQRLTTVESDLLALINEERVAHDPARPELGRDPGMDTIIRWHVEKMAENHFLSHNDANGRESEARARYYGDDQSVRCSEIIQFWGGSPSGQVHYQGYFDSPLHHAGYLEEPPYNLGPTRWSGVAAFSGTGPAGTSFAGRSGSYTGVMLCSSPIGLTIDPFEE